MKAVLGLGLASLGRPGYMNLGHGEDLRGRTAVEQMRLHCHSVLDAAFAAGIRDFDAARSYGRAEEFLATWLRTSRPQGVTISSKWGYIYTADWQSTAQRHEVKDHSIENLRRQWQESRALLGDRIALYQIHSATIESGVLADRAVLAELARIKESGVRIGLSLSGTQQSDTLRRARELHHEGRHLFEAVQATCNLLESSVSPALQEAHAGGMQVIIKEGLANGRLSDRNTIPQDQKAVEALRRFAGERGAAMDAIALAWILRQPWVDIALSGATTVAQLQSNLTAMDRRGDEALETLIEQTKQSPDEYWRLRSGLSWA